MLNDATNLDKVKEPGMRYVPGVFWDRKLLTTSRFLTKTAKIVPVHAPWLNCMCKNCHFGVYRADMRAVGVGYQMSYLCERALLSECDSARETFGRYSTVSPRSLAFILFVSAAATSFVIIGMWQASSSSVTGILLAMACLNPQAVFAAPSELWIGRRDATFCVCQLYQNEQADKALILTATQCSTLAGLNIPVYYPASTEYTESVDSYWSATAQLTPWCIATPRNASEVSVVVTALSNGTEQCEFAVRSGGHMPWAGASDIENGVTIDLGLMNSTNVNDNGTATVLPGAVWGSVYEVVSSLVETPLKVG
jgi:hypothetical protein